MRKIKTQVTSISTEFTTPDDKCLIELAVSFLLMYSVEKADSGTQGLVSRQLHVAISSCASERKFLYITKKSLL